MGDAAVLIGSSGAMAHGEGERMETLPTLARSRMARGPRSRVAGFFTFVASALVILAGCAGAQTSSAPSGLATRLSTASAVVTPQFDPGVGAPLPNNRIVAAYGIVGGIDANGPASTLDMLNSYLPQLQSLGKQYAELDPIHPVKLGIDLVVNVIQPCSAFPRYCGSWPDDSVIQAYIDFAKQHDLLVFFDLQLAVEPVEHAVTEHLLPYLKQYPFTELALDTEFHFQDNPTGYARAAAYPSYTGCVDAKDINWAADQLAQISLTNHLPRKVLLIHQFSPVVFSADVACQNTNKDQIKRNPNVSLVLQADGFGGYVDKAARYQEFVQQELLEYGGYKVFYHYSDSGSFDFADFSNPAPQTPQEVLQLFPQPIFISYQ